MQKIPILAELTEEAFKSFSMEVQQYQTSWVWSSSIAYNIKKKVERLWEMGQGKKWMEVDQSTKVEFLLGMQAVIKRAAGHIKSERIMIEDPMLRWSEGLIDWEDICEQIEDRDLEGQAICRAVTLMFRDTKYYGEVQREMSTIRKSDLNVADPLLISISMAKRAVHLVDQEGGGADLEKPNRMIYYGMQQSSKKWYDNKKIFSKKGYDTGLPDLEGVTNGNGELGCYKCGGFGHIKRDCPSRDKEATPRRKPIEEVVCFICGLKGHYASSCPSKMPEDEGKEEETKRAAPGKTMQTKVTFQTKKGTNNAVTAVQAATK